MMKKYKGLGQCRNRLEGRLKTLGMLIGASEVSVQERSN